MNTQELERICEQEFAREGLSSPGETVDVSLEPDQSIYIVYAPCRYNNPEESDSCSVTSMMFRLNECPDIGTIIGGIDIDPEYAGIDVSRRMLSAAENIFRQYGCIASLVYGGADSQRPLSNQNFWRSQGYTLNDAGSAA